MIDFVKLHYTDKTKLENFIVNEKNYEELEMILEEGTGDIRYPYRTQIGNMHIVISKKTAHVKGSVHKHWNFVQLGKEQNYNDYMYSNFIETVNLLSPKIIEFESTKITQLEMGFNLVTSINPSNILNNNLVFHRVKIHNVDSPFKEDGKYIQYTYNQYYIKIYDKGLQNDLFGQNILRFEVKFVSSKLLNSLGCNCLNDLKNKDVLRSLFEYVLNKFDELVILDEFSEKSNITDKDKILLDKYTNNRFWKVDLLNKSRTTKSKYLKHFKELINKHKLNSLSNELRLQLIDNFNYLLDN
jgi:hypothetical protein